MNSAVALRLWTIIVLNELLYCPRAGDEPDEVVVREDAGSQYSVETLILAIICGTFTALLVGFAAGFICGRKCQKDDDDNIPYPDTEYEYFEQRQNVNV